MAVPRRTASEAPSLGRTQSSASQFHGLAPSFTVATELGSEASVSDVHPPLHTPPTLWQQMKDGYQTLVNTVIRPYRAIYSPADLGSSTILLHSTIVEREDIELVNKRGHTLQCSWWKPAQDEPSSSEKRPCIVVLHGNSSCRLGALDVLITGIAAGFSVFALDCSGSGLSEGDYVSLGHYESEDAEVAMEYLNQSGRVSCIAIWGRSMGAVAAILCASRNPSIKAIVVDCPFAKLTQLALDLVDEGKLVVPKFLVSAVMQMVRRSIKKTAGFDMYKLRPIDVVSSMTVPALFGVANDDELIPPKHGEQLYKKYGGPKHFIRFTGGHNSQRPGDFYRTAIEFLVNYTGAPGAKFVKKKNMTNRELGRRKVKDPVPAGMSLDELQAKSIRELKQMLDGAGVDITTCVERQDLVEKILTAHELFAGERLR